MNCEHGHRYVPCGILTEQGLVLWALITGESLATDGNGKETAREDERTSKEKGPPNNSHRLITCPPKGGGETLECIRSAQGADSNSQVRRVANDGGSEEKVREKGRAVKVHGLLDIARGTYRKSSNGL